MMRDRPARRRLAAMLERGCATVTTFISAAALGYEAVLTVKSGFLMVPWAEDRVAVALA
ncbi:hypothetical protein [Nonomuraea turcica]|uniref:hypothetical protein n=1 Tax=Nonomuraea sp. G32 TaxID=3067274 RepID=UPI00273AC9CB|nr:hypothetical protein [Nonomuraea sp. G32]MDP4504346.1 hypothetical protein [Nonomuraea sp. G32]